MGRPPFSSLADRAAWDRVLRRWRSAARRVDTLDPATLQDLAARAQALTPALSRITDTACGAAHGLPGPDTPPDPLPPRTDWTWRPAPWSQPLRPPGAAGMSTGYPVAPGVTLHHDCPLSLLTLRQSPEPDGWRVTLDWPDFAGSYLSLVLQLPPEGLAGLSQDHVLSLSARRRSEVGGTLYARLNIRSGPNLTQMNLHGGFDGTPARTEFDLAYAEFEPARVSEVWIDLIFEAHKANAVSLEDLCLTRHRRAML